MAVLDADLRTLAAYLARRRAAIIRAWQAAVTADASLSSGAALPRAQLRDHIPALLADFERALVAGIEQANAMQRSDAAAHGLHRWQQGFGLAEVTRELSTLNECVVAELESCASALPALDPAVLPLARRIWARQYGASLSASTTQYFRLQKLEANSHITDLEHALCTLRDLDQHRARVWHQAAHDLRGNLGVVANATAGLASASANEAARIEFLRLLDRNVKALRHLLNDVTSLALLQSGQETRSIKPMDAGALLRELCEGLQEHARERKLYLHCEGPANLAVQGDEVKTRRIAQNLALNAIKYTLQGGVTISWGLCDHDDQRWFIQVQDTGPGFHAGPGSPLVGALEKATDQGKQIDADNASGKVSHAHVRPDDVERPDGDARPVRQGAGEGIGLSIVKRLCELLDAAVEMESKIDVGTTVRVLLPREFRTVEGKASE